MDDTRDDNEVELRLAASPEHLPVPRAVAASLAIGADFDMDRVEDARLLTDELCSLLIRHAAARATLVCRFLVDGASLRIVGEVELGESGEPDAGSFGWRVMTSLADSVRGWTSTDDGRGTRMHVVVVERADTEHDRGAAI